MKTTQTVILAALLAIGLGCGYSSKSNMPATPGTMPAITQLDPASQTAGDAAFQLEIDGTNFAASATVSFNGAPMNVTTRTGSSKVMVMVPATAIMNAGTVPVTVTNPGTPGGPYGGGTTSETATANFTIN
jgi:trimeric autotransporter adhesin